MALCAPPHGPTDHSYKKASRNDKGKDKAHRNKKTSNPYGYAADRKYARISIAREAGARRRAEEGWGKTGKPAGQYMLAWAQALTNIENYIAIWMGHGRAPQQQRAESKRRADEPPGGKSGPWGRSTAAES